MTNSTTPTSRDDRGTPPGSVPLRRTPLWLGATVFLLAYLAVSPVQGALSDRAAPLPDDPAVELLEYVRANPEAVFAVAVLQALSVLGFLVFLRAVLPALQAAGEATAGRLQAAGLVSVAAMLASSALGCMVAGVASSSSADTVADLRMASFYAGGVANVATLGLFVFGAARVLAHSGAVGRGTKWFGYVAGVLAMLSVLSLAFYYANAFLPIGRVLSMVWIVLAAVVLLRRMRPSAT
jgi:hypothetical protein